MFIEMLVILTRGRGYQAHKGFFFVLHCETEEYSYTNKIASNFHCSRQSARVQNPESIRLISGGYPMPGRSEEGFLVRFFYSMCFPEHNFWPVLG